MTAGESVSSFVVSFSLVYTLGSFDLLLLLWTCFLATNLIWPARKRSVAPSSQLESGWQWGTHLAFLWAVWVLWGACHFCYCRPVRCHCCCSHDPPALVQFLSHATAEQSRAQGFSCGSTLLLSGHVKDAKVYLESQTLWRKMNKHKKCYQFFPPKIQ